MDTHTRVPVLLIWDTQDAQLHTHTLMFTSDKCSSCIRRQTSQRSWSCCYCCWIWLFGVISVILQWSLWAASSVSRYDPSSCRMLLRAPTLCGRQRTKSCDCVWARICNWMFWRICLLRWCFVSGHTMTYSFISNCQAAITTTTWEVEWYTYI